MRRAPIVAGSTAVGLGLVLSFHSHSPSLSKLSVGSTNAATPATPTTPATAAPTTSPTTQAPATRQAQPAPSTSPPTTAPASARSGTGQDIQYQYGDIQLQVFEKGSRITRIKVLQEGATDMRSQEINSQAVPMLQQQAMQAQSAKIDGVSGATFTSYAYAQALQSAIDQLRV